MDLKEDLRRFRAHVLDPDGNDRAVELWNTLKPNLSVKRRVLILTAWNQYLRTQRHRGFAEAVEQVISDLDK